MNVDYTKDPYESVFHRTRWFRVGTLYHIDIDHGLAEWRSPCGITRGPGPRDSMIDDAYVPRLPRPPQGTQLCPACKDAYAAWLMRRL